MNEPKEIKMKLLPPDSFEPHCEVTKDSKKIGCLSYN